MSVCAVYYRLAKLGIWLRQLRNRESLWAHLLETQTKELVREEAAKIFEPLLKEREE